MKMLTGKVLLRSFANINKKYLLIKEDQRKPKSAHKQTGPEDLFIYLF